MIARLLGLIAVCTAITLTAPAPLYRISGTVVDSETHAPIGGAEVEVAPTDKRNIVETVFANAQGQFSFTNLFAGKYIVTAAHTGYISAWYQQHGPYLTGVAVGPDLSADRLTVPLERECSISGTVIDQDGDPVSNAQITALRLGVVEGLRVITSAGNAQTEPDGRYRLRGLRRGSYFLVVVAQPWYAVYQYPAMQSNMDAAQPGARPMQSKTFETNVAYPVTFYPGNAANASADPLNLTSGAHTEASFTLTTVPAARLTIPRSNGANTNAQLFAANPWSIRIPVHSMYFNGAGQTFIVAPGQYEVTAAWQDGKGRHGASRVVEVGGDMTLDSAALVTGLSVTASVEGLTAGGRRGGAPFLRSLATAQAFPAFRSKDGEFFWPAQELSANRYEVIWQGGDGLYLASLKATNAKVSGRLIELPQSAPVHIALTLAPGAATIRGIVQSDGAVAPGNMVLLIPDSVATSPSMVRRDQSDSDGSFELRDVAPGRYTLLAIPADDDLEYANPAVIGPYLNGGLRVTVAPGGNYTQTIELSNTVRR